VVVDEVKTLPETFALLTNTRMYIYYVGAGLCRCGWSTVGASLNLGTDQQGFGFGGTGKKSHARQFDDFGEP